MAKTHISTRKKKRPAPFRSYKPHRAKLKSIGPGGTTIIEFPFGPMNMKYDQIAPVVVELERPNRPPLLVREAAQLRTVTFEAVLANRGSGGRNSIVSLLNRIDNLVQSGRTCKFIYGLTALSFNVTVSEYSYTVRYRNNAGEPIRAEVSIQLTETPGFSPTLITLGPIAGVPGTTTATAKTSGSGGSGGSPTTPNPPSPPDPNKKKPKHKIHSGD